MVATRRPETLADSAILTTLAIAASALLLLRQLGVVSLVLAAVVALSRGRCHGGLAPAASGRPAMIVTMGIVALAAMAILRWERTFDHPAITASVASWLSAANHAAFIDLSFNVFRQGIGWLGWVDTPLPGPATALWW